MGVPPDINACHRYTGNSSYLYVPLAYQYAEQFPR